MNKLKQRIRYKLLEFLMPVNKYYGDSSYELKDQYLRPIVREELASIVNSNPEFHKLLLKIVNEN